MPLTVRYVRSNAAQNLDGLSLANAMNINDALRTASGNCEYRILNDGLHVVTGNITLVPTGLAATTPAYYVGYSDISGLVTADWQVSGYRQRIDHMPRIWFSGAVNYSNTVAPHCNFANLVISGTINGTLVNSTASYCNFHNLFVQNASTGSSAQAIAVGFRNNVTYSTLITSGIVNNGFALNIANSLNATAYRCRVSAPSGNGVQLNNPGSLVDCLIENCRRGVRQMGSSAGDGYVYGCLFVNCNDYCVAQRNSIVSHSGQLLVIGNCSYNSGPMTALADANGTIDYAYTTGSPIVQFGNLEYNTLAAATGFDSHMRLSCVTGVMSATNMFVDVSGKDFRLTSRATGIYDRNIFNESVGVGGLGVAVRTPRLM